MTRENAEKPVKEFTFQAIGHIVNQHQFHCDAPRQAVFAAGESLLEWNDPVYSKCAEDLKGFDRIWLIWVFDQNSHCNFRSKVRVPIPAEKDHYSVFSTRSPYRPNPIGISAVELLDISDKGLLIGPCDLLNGTAVLDVKPYIPEADAFPEAKAGWRDRVEKERYIVKMTSEAAGQCRFIQENGALDIANFCTVQLQHRPLDKSRKRLEFDEAGNRWVIHYRTWKIYFSADETLKQIKVHSIASNYSSEDLQMGSVDKYQDKELHRSFNRIFLPENC